MYLTMKFDCFRLKSNKNFESFFLLIENCCIIFWSHLWFFLFFTPNKSRHYDAEELFIRSVNITSRSSSFCRHLSEGIFFCLVIFAHLKTKACSEIYDRTSWPIRNNIFWSYDITPSAFISLQSFCSMHGMKPTKNRWKIISGFILEMNDVEIAIKRNQAAKKRWCNDDHYFFHSRTPTRRFQG